MKRISIIRSLLFSSMLFIAFFGFASAGTWVSDTPTLIVDSPGACTSFVETCGIGGPFDPCSVGETCSNGFVPADFANCYWFNYMCVDGGSPPPTPPTPEPFTPSSCWSLDQQNYSTGCSPTGGPLASWVSALPNTCTLSETRSFCGAGSGGTIYDFSCTNPSCAPAPLCGNGVIDPGEECDGGNLNGISCTTGGGGAYWGPTYTGGSLSCSSSCNFDTSSCTTPGPCQPNGTRVGTEMMCTGSSEIRADAQCCSGTAVKSACAVPPAEWICGNAPSCIPDGGVAFTDPFPNSCSMTQNTFDHPSCCSPIAYNTCGSSNRHVVVCGPAIPPSGCSATTIANCDLSATGHLGSSGSCSGSYSGSCNYTCSNGSWIQNTNSCSLDTADISLPATLNFGPVPVGSYVERTLVVTNAGTLPVSGSISLPWVSGGLYSCPYGCGYSVSPWSPTDSIVIRLDASLGNNFDDTASVGGVTPNKFVALEGVGVTDTALDVRLVGVGSIGDPHAVYIGDIGVGAPSRSYDFEVRNGGSGAMTFNAFVSGGAAAGYTLTPVSGWDGCGGGSAIANGDSPRVCRVTFDPDPSIPGSRDARIIFDNTTSGAISGYDPINVDFSANVVSSGSVAGVSANPGPASPVMAVGTDFIVDFGARTIGQTFTQVIGITNSGDVDLFGNYSNLSLANFSTSGSGNVYVTPWGAPHLITVNFTPQGVVVPDAVLVVDADAGNLPGGDIRIVIRGSGISSPSVAVTPEGQLTRSWGSGSANLPFAPQEIYLGTGESKRVTVENTGSAQTTISAVSSHPAFTVSPSSLTLDPSDTSDFTVTFNPDVPAGTKNGAVTLDATGIGANFDVFVSGDGYIDPPALSLPDPFPFGRVIVSKFKELDLTIRSTDPRPIDFTGVVNPLGLPVFTCVSANCGVPFTLNQDDTRTFTIRFAPTAIGIYTGALQFDVITAGMSDPAPIVLTGTGVRPNIQYSEE